MRRINLLPPEIEERRRVRRATGGLLAGLVILAFILAAVWFIRNETLQREIERRDVALAQVRELQEKIAALQEFADLERNVKAKQATLQVAMAGDVAWSRLLVELSMIIPGDSWLTQFTGTGAGPTSSVPTAPAPGAPAVGPAALGTVNFTVVAFDFPGVAKWITRLQELKSLQTIWVPTASKGEIAGRDVINYTSTAELSQDSASGRYQTQGGTPR